MHSADILAAALKAIAPVPINGTFHRAVANAALYQGRRKPKYLYSLGPGRSGARYSPIGGPPCLYVSEEPVTTLSEAGGIASSLVRAGIAIAQPTTAFSMNVNLHRGALDLTDAGVVEQLGTSFIELDGPWEQQALTGGPIPTQDLGIEAYATKRFQGILFFSHEDPGKKNLVIWTATIKSPSVVTVIDSSNATTERIPRVRRKRN
jgi:RES domain-containing protein